MSSEQPPARAETAALPSLTGRPLPAERAAALSEQLHRMRQALWAIALPPEVEPWVTPGIHAVASLETVRRSDA